MTNREHDVLIEVTSRHQNISDKTRDIATERVSRLTRFNDRISRIQLLLEEEHGEFQAELIVHVESGVTLVSKDSEKEGYRTAIDAVLEKMERQLKKDKERRVNHKHPQPEGGTGGDVEPDADPSFEDAVRDDL